MGYTHYFQHKKTPKATWNEIVADCKKLSENLPSDVLIDGCSAYPEPQFNGKEILFNGTDEGFTFKQHEADEYPENSHETFILNQAGSGGYVFCKTDRKPYDLMVCACLLVYKYYSPKTMDLSSDGKEPDWKDAEKFVKKILGNTIKFKDAKGK